MASDVRMRSASFLTLVLAQTAHSIEEFAFRLYDRLAPARYLSGLIATDRALGFAVINAVIVLLGLWCWSTQIVRRTSKARSWAFGWAFVELANGIGHIGLTVSTRNYFPGAATAPLLIIFAISVIVAFSQQSRPA